MAGYSQIQVACAGSLSGQKLTAELSPGRGGGGWKVMATTGRRDGKGLETDTRATTGVLLYARQ